MVAISTSSSSSSRIKLSLHFQLPDSLALLSPLWNEVTFCPTFLPGTVKKVNRMSVARRGNLAAITSRLCFSHQRFLRGQRMVKWVFRLTIHQGHETTTGNASSFAFYIIFKGQRRFNWVLVCVSLELLLLEMPTTTSGCSWAAKCLMRYDPTCLRDPCGKHVALPSSLNLDVREWEENRKESYAEHSCAGNECSRHGSTEESIWEDH